MKILVAGSTGLIGSALSASLAADNHQVFRLVRTPSATLANDISWNPSLGTINPAALEGFDAVANLGGESIAGARWTPETKRRIVNSRIQGTKLLVDALCRLEKPPAVFVSASAIGYYGDRGTETLYEGSLPGDGFLPDLCRQWEEAAQAASAAGIRVVTPRIGIVLSRHGGALPRMLLPFRFGLGGRIGSGRQYMSWIALDDLIGAIRHMIQDEELRGPVNAVSPRPVTNREFVSTLGHVLSRPSIFPLPAFAARIALGEMADELLLSGARIEPARLSAAGFQFRFPELEGALRHILQA